MIHKIIKALRKIISRLNAWRIYNKYLSAQDKDTYLSKLSFDHLRKLSEFSNGILKNEIGTYLLTNPECNSQFQEWWFSRSNPEGKFDHNLKIYQKLQNLITSNNTIKEFIDLGCNLGEVVYHVSELGVNAVGVDFPSVIERISLPINTFSMDLNKKFPSGKYDIIFCRETLEHITNPDLFLANCGQISNPGGYLFISCPFTNRQYRSNAFHLRIFKQEQLADILKKHGFKILETMIDGESNVLIARCEA